jgi:hypothetical protein
MGGRERERKNITRYKYKMIMENRKGGVNDDVTKQIIPC